MLIPPPAGREHLPQEAHATLQKSSDLRSIALASVNRIPIPLHKPIASASQKMTSYEPVAKMLIVLCRKALDTERQVNVFGVLCQVQKLPVGMWLEDFCQELETKDTKTIQCLWQAVEQMCGVSGDELQTLAQTRQYDRLEQLFPKGPEIASFIFEQILEV